MIDKDNDIKGNYVEFCDDGDDNGQAYVRLSVYYADFDPEHIALEFFTRKETEYLRCVDLRLKGEVVREQLDYAHWMGDSTISIYALKDYKHGVIMRARETERLQKLRLTSGVEVE